MKKIFLNIISNIITIIIVISFLFYFFNSKLNFDSSKNSKIVKLNQNTILELDFDESAIVERDGELNPLVNLSNKNIILKKLIDCIIHARYDPNILGISLKLDNFNSGITQASYIRSALLDFKRSGKFIYCYSNNMNQVAYYLSSVSDSIFQNRFGSVVLKGFGASKNYYGKILNKYGIGLNVVKIGKYKSSPDIYSNNSMSPEDKEQLTDMINDLWKHFSSDICKSRNIDINKFNLITDSLYSLYPKKGLKYKLFDAICDETEYNKFLFTKANINKNNIINVHDYLFHVKNRNKGDKIAILYLTGVITDTDAGNGIYAKKYIEEIDKIENQGYKALILRINSPGGSVLGTYKIFKRLKKLNIPIVSSFGDICASGGYYISMASNYIYAHNNTITGSIGVYTMYPNFNNLLKNIYINREYINTNLNSHFQDYYKPLSKSANIIMYEKISDIYKNFLTVVELNRKLDKKNIEYVSNGHVWSGYKAKNIGLIDELGDLNDAINKAVKLSKLNESYYIDEFPKNDIIKHISNYFKINNVAKNLLSNFFTYNIYEDKNIKDNIYLIFPYSISY